MKRRAEFDAIQMNATPIMVRFVDAEPGVATEADVVRRSIDHPLLIEVPGVAAGRRIRAPFIIVDGDLRYIPRLLLDGLGDHGATTVESGYVTCTVDDDAVVIHLERSAGATWDDPVGHYRIYGLHDELVSLGEVDLTLYVLPEARQGAIAKTLAAVRRFLRR